MISSNQPSIKCLIAAAGQGTRSGLPYPKTLFSIKNKPILVRICELLRSYNDTPSVIINPLWEDKINQSLEQHQLNAELIYQNEPLGMGDAVLQYENSPSFHNTEHVILVWGDIPFIQPSTLHEMVNIHLKNKNILTFPTKYVDSAYTFVARDDSGNVQELIETRELGILEPQPGERDIGLFIFQKDPIFSLLKEDLSGKIGTKTLEHGFLYIIKHLCNQGFKVEALDIASEEDLVSLNSIDDVTSYL